MPDPKGSLTIQECADDLAVSPDTVLAYIRAGRLAALYIGTGPAPPPGKGGARPYRVERAEWERFKRAIRVRPDPPGMDPSSPQPEAAPPPAGRPLRRMKGYR